MKTNSKQVREQIRQHILDCVYNYDETYFTNINDACKHLYNEFNRVANHENNKKRYPIDQQRFSDYLQGLPFHFEYYNTAIIEYLNSLGINPENKKFDIDKSIKLYHYLIFREMNANL